MKKLIIIQLLVFLISILNATIINIPGDFNTIQLGINVAAEGDTVLVADGTYFENLTLDKNIILASHYIIDGDISHRENTIIDGSSAPSGSTYGSCVLFLNGSNRIDDDIRTEFTGFTVRGGKGTKVQKTIDTPNGPQQTQKTVGGGMMIMNTYPNVNNNHFKNNGDSGSEDRVNSGGAVYGYEGTGIDFDETRNNWSSAIYQVNREDSLNFTDNIFDDNWAESGNSIIIEGYETTIDMSNGFFDVYNSDEEEVSNYWANSDNSTFDFGGGNGEAEAITNDVFVSINGSDDNDGSESSPFLTIAYAMSLVYGSSENPVVIHLEAGTYSASTNGEQFPLTMVDWVSLVGAGEEITILDGEENSTILIFENTENSSAEQLTIVNGSDYSMGAVYCNNASPTILDVTIKDSDSYLQGGGMVCQNNSNPTLTRVTFLENVGYTVGGLLCGNNSSPILNDCIFSGNSSEQYAGGMLCYSGSNPILTNVSFINNVGYKGGGLVCKNNSNATLSGCTISGNIATVDGGGILCEDNSSPSLENTTISHNNAYRGGGIFAEGGSDLFLTNVVVDSNIVDDSGAGIFISESQTSFSGVTVSNNTAPESGGGIYIYETSNLDLSGATIINNKSIQGNGGGLYLYYVPSPTISDLIITGNSAYQGAGIFYYYSENSNTSSVTVSENISSHHGGGVYFDYSDNATLSEVIITNNEGLSGGGLSTYFTDNAHLINCEIVGNTSNYDGGGIYFYNSESPTCENSLINNNSSTHSGGGIYVYDLLTPTFLNCEISGNTTVNNGGAVLLDYSPGANFDGVTMENNSASVDGGAVFIYFSENSSFENSEINENISSQHGGAIYVSYTSNISVNSSKINNNSANGNGGAVYSINSPVLKLENVEVVGNSASLQGGGFFLNYTETEITNCTIVNNSAENPYDAGGGVLPYYSETDIINSIVWDNTPSQIEYDSWWGTGSNVSYSDIQGGWDGTGNIDADPLFCDVENYDYHLTENSPCVGTGENGTNMGALGVCYVNNPPIAYNIYVATDEDVAVEITLTGSDADGDWLTYFLHLPELLPEHGTLSGDLPNLTYTPDADWYGVDGFYYYVSDGMLDSEIALVQIVVNDVIDNTPPIANGMEVETNEDTAVEIILTADDAEGDNLTFIIVEEPIYGTLSGDAPNLTYTPNADYFGYDTFSFIANDGEFDSPSPAYVTITVNEVNDFVTQTIPLATGWNWFSINIESDDMSLDNVLYSLGENATLIKNQTEFATYYEGFGWYGLDAIDVTSMYMIQMTTSADLVLEGTAVDYQNIPIALSSGWNWIGYLPQALNNLESALASIGENANLIKSQTEFATYYEGFGWYGMDSLNPGDGYMINMNASATLIYGIPDGLVRNDEASIDFHWSVNPHQFEHNMTITADVEIDGIQISEDDQLGVFVNGECRGTAVPTYFPLTDSYTINLMTYGETGDELSFRVYQSETNTEIEVLDNLTFEINGIIGNDIDPILLRAVVIPDEYSLSQNYPNPFNPSTTISYQLPAPGSVLLAIYNVNGQLIEELVSSMQEAGYHQITWNADNQPSGLYFVRMTAGEDVSTQKMLLLK